MALETSLDAYFPSTLSLIGLYGRALYHVLFHSGEDELNALSLFGKDPGVSSDTHDNSPASYSVWSFGRAWRDIQRHWGIDPGPEPELVAVHPPQNAQNAQQGQEQAGDGGHVEQPRDVAAARNALEGNEDATEWTQWQEQRGYGRRDGEEEEDEFFLDDEGDFGGTIAIVGLCTILASVLFFLSRLDSVLTFFLPFLSPLTAGSSTSANAPLKPTLLTPPLPQQQQHHPHPLTPSLSRRLKLNRLLHLNPLTLLRLRRWIRQGRGARTTTTRLR